MAERPSVLNISQWGVETVPGTQVPTTKRLLATSMDPEPNTPTTPFRALGSLTPTTVIQQKEWTAGNVGGVMSFNDLVYLYSSALTKVTPTTPGSAINTRRWSFKPLQFAQDAFQSFTIQRGLPAGAGAESWGYCMIDSLTHRWTRTEAVQTGTFFGQALAEQITLTGGPTDVAPLPIDPKSVTLYAGTSFSTNNVQTLTISVAGGAATGGTFTISLDNQTTAPIAFNATGPVGVQLALQLLANIGTNNVTVTGAAGGPYVVTFADRLAGVNPSLLVGNGAALTGPGSPYTIATVNTTPGSMTKLLRVTSFEWALPSRFTPEFTLNQGDPSFSYFVNKGIEPISTLVLEHDSVSAGFMTNLRAKTQTYLAVIAYGAPVEISGAINFPNIFRLTMPFKFTQSARGDVDDVYAATYSISQQYDSTFAGYVQIDIDTAIAAL
jgi:hypothetical protein